MPELPTAITLSLRSMYSDLASSLTRVLLRLNVQYDNDGIFLYRKKFN